MASMWAGHRVGVAVAGARTPKRAEGRPGEGSGAEGDAEGGSERREA